MLQASEYNIPDYLKWLSRVTDFRKVEKRKQLKKTPKAILILIALWAMLVAFILLALWLLSLKTALGITLSIVTIITLPFLLAYGVIIPVFKIRIFIQKPIEYFMLCGAKKKLLKHKAIKIAIAGSYGKTTMREILKTVLAEGKRVACPPDSYNTPLGIASFVKTLTGDEEVLIFEMGEYYPGDIRKLCNLIQPSLGIITGVNEAHFHKFKTLDKTVKTIYELADFLKDKPLYVNGENKLARENARQGSVIYSREGAGDFKVKNAQTDLNGVSFSIYPPQLEFSSSLLGLHQIGPLIASMHIAFQIGLTPDEVKRGVANTKPFSHRLEPKTDNTGVITLDDSYNGNPDGVRAVIDFLSSLTGHRRLYVTPGLVEMGTRAEEVHQNIGRWLAEASIEQVVLIKNSVTPYIEEGLKNAGYKGKVIWFDEALEAFSALPHMTAEGDVVLLQNDWPDQYA
jgi:UDP-N-acetylmuramoyl-tripeptide--D-alanyl-D-alanine ligase